MTWTLIPLVSHGAATYLSDVWERKSQEWVAVSVGHRNTRSEMLG
jgi:hypothetical protein